MQHQMWLQRNKFFPLLDEAALKLCEEYENSQASVVVFPQWVRRNSVAGPGPGETRHWSGGRRWTIAFMSGISQPDSSTICTDIVDGLNPANHLGSIKPCK